MPVASPRRPEDPIILGSTPCWPCGGRQDGVVDGDRRAARRVDNDRPRRPRRRRWGGGLLVVAVLAAALGILLPRLDATPTGGPPGDGRPAAATPSTSDGGALPAWGLLYEAATTVKGVTTWDIWVASPDGIGRRNLTRDAAEDADPAWSPDGRKIVYGSTPSRCRGSRCQRDLYTIGRDGQHRRRLTNTPKDELTPGFDTLIWPHLGPL
jgi:hypothetical protein